MALLKSSAPVALRQSPTTESNEMPVGWSRQTEIQVEPQPPATNEASLAVAVEEEEKVYVAMGKEVKEGKANLLWTLHNLSSGRKIVIVHVHRPAQTIPILGLRFPASQLKEQEVKAYRQSERVEMDKSLNEYLNICSRIKVKAEKLVIEKDDVGKGLIELISRHRITKLVMGAAADKKYSRKLKEPKSKLALSIQQLADSFCKVWFVCKGNLICTRESTLNESNPTELTTVSQRSYTGHPEQITSRSLFWQIESQSWYSSPGLQNHKPAPGSYSSLASVNLYFTPFHKNEELEEEPLSFPSAQEPQNHEILPLLPELEDAEAKNGEYDKLTFAEAESLKYVNYEEVRRCRETEKELYQVVQKVKTLENLYAKEITLRKEIEERLVREKTEVDKLTEQRDDIFKELQKEREKISALENHIAYCDRRIKELLLERETIQEGNAKQEQSTSKHVKINILEFSYTELQQATNNFDESCKIGEGGYGSVYKGFLRHTKVAIKMLNRQSKQREYNQEVDVLSQLRHPNLVTFIGACREACALVYEYLPNGSLEDRLVCKNNTMPLTWQVRVKIAVDVCSALIFLHSNKPYSTIHGDLKPSNILLDANFVSKLCEYGNCRCLAECNATTTLYRQTHPKGTFAYIDPEFLLSGNLRPQSDVYSFGIIILRLLTGRPAVGLAREVHEAVDKGSLQAILDASAGDWPLLQTENLARLSLRCCEIKRKNRPDLSEFWNVLEPMLKSSLSSTNSFSFQSVSDDSICVPSYFICPILQEIMRDPHVAADGFTYEAGAIKGWLDAGHDTSPMTNLKLAHCDLLPNHALRSAIQQWLQQQG